MEGVFGKQTNNYIINQNELKEVKTLGEGLFGIVYLGTFRGNRVAIKKMKGEFDESKIRKFEKEVKLLDKFRSEYIIYFYGAVLIPNKVCVVTEFAPFGSLQDLIRKIREEPISDYLRIKILLDSAKGIEYLHSNGILHCDIKPDNILVMSLNENEQVNAKLTDFASSRNIDLFTKNMNLTVYIGSPAYLAPELMENDRYNEKADVYSFAITMYECFGWCYCYPKSEFKFSWKIAEFVNEGKRRPKTDNMTNEQYQLIDKCWKQDPNERFEINDIVSILCYQELRIRKEDDEIKKRINTIIDMKEMKQIEKWTQMKIRNIIFDSKNDSWKRDTSTFDKKIINRNNLIFLIEDDDGNLFGVYFNSRINNCCVSLNDPKSFIFSLRSNGRLNGMMKFNVIDPEIPFNLGNSTAIELFSIGGNVILVYKGDCRLTSSCEQRRYDYYGIQNALCGNVSFMPKRIVVIQLLDKEMKQLEKWTQMKIGNIIFDSSNYNWGCYTSEFDKKIINKSNLIFLIEDDDNNLFGGYVDAKINKSYNWIDDPKSFVFSLKSNVSSNEMMKFDITHSQYAFELGNLTDDYLFSIGISDIHIFKESYKEKSYCNQQSFNYNGIENTLCGKLYFIPKRISVIQLI